VIVIDSSALVAIVNREPERVSFLSVIAGADYCFISAESLLETRMVVRGRFGAGGLRELGALMAEIAPEVNAFDTSQCDAALDAFERFGKGLGTAAKLNLGDCASYALAKSLSVPLLFKGDDFKHTDLIAAATAT
jgi:ribonuclease VapC